MLDLQLPQLLSPSQSCLEFVDPTIEIVLGLVEDLLGLQDLQDPLLPLQHLPGEEEVRELVHRYLGLVALRLEQIRTRRRGWLQGLHPVWSRRHFWLRVWGIEI